MKPYILLHYVLVERQSPPPPLISRCVHNHLLFLKHPIVVVCLLSTTACFGVILLLVAYNYQHVASSPPTSGFCSHGSHGYPTMHGFFVFY